MTTGTLLVHRPLKGKVTVGHGKDPTGWVKEAERIRKEGHRAMNRDEGSHAYDRFLDTTADWYAVDIAVPC